jgi:hypothetical protein
MKRGACSMPGNSEASTQITADPVQNNEAGGRKWKERFLRILEQLKLRSRVKKASSKLSLGQTEVPQLKSALLKESNEQTALLEKEQPKSYLQMLGEQPLVSLDEMLGLPETEDANFGVTAELVANNEMSPETEEKLKSLKLNGNIIGIGTASIFAMLEAFENCESFTSIDIHPSPVAIGRVLTGLFVENEQFENFLLTLSDEEKLSERLLKVGLPKKYIRSAAESLRTALKMFRDAADPRGFDTEKNGIHVLKDGTRNLFPLELIRLHYLELRNLALKKKMNFIQENFFWPKFWTDLDRQEPEMKSSQNIVFLSNGLDHVFRSKVPVWDQWDREGKQQFTSEEQRTIGGIVALNFREWFNSKFVFTLTNLDYQLHLSRTPPVFAFESKGLVLKEENPV